MMARWIDENSIEYVIACTYAESKGYLFNSFFGWRKTRKNMAKVTLSKHGWEIVDQMVRYYKIFVENNDKKY